MSNLKLKIILTVLISLLAVSMAEAGVSLDLGMAGIGARPLGMGRAYVAVADDANAVFANPAGLGLQENWSITSMSTKLMDKANYTLAGGALPFAGGTFGVGYIGLQSPAGYEVDENNIVGDTISYNSSEIILSYGRNLKKSVRGSNLGDLSIGASLKLINHQFEGFDGNAQGTSLDLGVMYKPSENVSLGANFANLGGKVKWNSDKEEEVESSSEFGGAVKLMEGKLLASAGMNFSLNTERPVLMHGGLEYRPLDFLSIRGGIDQDALKVDEAVTNFTMGVGINFGGVSFDYAYRQDKHIESNARHYFSLSLRPDASGLFAQKAEKIAQKEEEKSQPDTVITQIEKKEEIDILSYYR